MDSYSNSASEMNANTDPNSSGAQSAATTLAGELERLRYVLKHVTGWSQWWTHFEDLNVGDRGLRVHRTLATNFHAWLRIEGHTASAATRFHLVALSIPGYTAGTMHPESALFLIHVGTTVRFMVGPGGDIHVGNTLALHAAGSARFPALYRYQHADTGLYFDTANHVGFTAGGLGVARIHAAGIATHAVLFMHASSGNFVSLAAHASSTATTRFVLPAADGTVGQVLETRGDGTLAWTSGIVAYGHTSAQTIGTRVLSSGSRFEPAAHAAATAVPNSLYKGNLVKAWISLHMAAVSTADAVLDSFGVSSVTDNATGKWTVTFINAFVVTNAGQYAVLSSTASRITTAVSCGYDDTDANSRAAGSARVICVRTDNAGLTDALAYFLFMGTQ